MTSVQERKIINSCHTCRNPIYEGEPIYSSSKAQSSGYGGGSYGGKRFEKVGYQVGAYGGYYSGTHASENWVQCSWCYDQWQAELVKNRNFWRKCWWRGLLFSVVITIISVFMLPGLENNSNIQQSGPEISWYRIRIFSLGSWKIPLIAPLTFSASILLTKFLGNFFQPVVARYKLRKQSTKL